MLGQFALELAAHEIICAEAPKRYLQKGVPQSAGADGKDQAYGANGKDQPYAPNTNTASSAARFCVIRTS